MGGLASRSPTPVQPPDPESGTPNNPYVPPTTAPSARSIFTEASGTYFGPHFVIDPGRVRAVLPGGADVPAGAGGIISTFWSEIRLFLSGSGGGTVGADLDPYAGVKLGDAEVEALARIRGNAAAPASETPSQTAQQTTTLQLLVNLKKNTIRLVRVPVAAVNGSLPEASSPSSSKTISPSYHHRLEFRFDATTECRIRVHYLIKEVMTVGGEGGGRRILYRSKDNSEPKTLTFGPFPPGLNQSFQLPNEHLLDARTFKPEDFVGVEVHSEEGTHEREESGGGEGSGPAVRGGANEGAGQAAEGAGSAGRTGGGNENTTSGNPANDSEGRWRLAGPIVYPVVVVLEAVQDQESESDPAPSPSPFNSQSTFATLVPGSDGALELKVVKQKAIMDSTPFLLQEIYGFTDPTSEPTLPGQEEDLQAMRDCVVCMSEPRDTTVLPCRHLCLCRECADVLRSRGAGGDRGTVGPEGVEVRGRGGPPRCPICRQGEFGGGMGNWSKQVQGCWSCSHQDLFCIFSVPFPVANQSAERVQKNWVGAECAKRTE
ncbi:hypothetical protein HDV00_011852 [Rhizophlyctis rosea]|nr:hypothetical protein HDV00_011852 [Rhizophlyctis rosea]